MARGCALSEEDEAPENTLRMEVTHEAAVGPAEGPWEPLGTEWWVGDSMTWSLEPDC